MNGDEQSRRKDWGSLTLCVLLSLLLHAGLAWALDLLPREQGGRQHRPAAHVTRHVQVLRATPKEKPKATTPPQPQEEQRDPEAPFAKTSADEPKFRKPEQADFIGSRDSVASGEEGAPQRSSDAPQPTMAGRESEEEVVTFDQERQDGELEHEGKLTDTPPAPAMPSISEPVPTSPPEAAAQGNPDGSPDMGELQGEGTQPPQPASESTAAREAEPAESGEGLKLDELRTDDALTLAPQLPPPAPLGQPEGTEGNAATPARAHQERAALYDPALAADAQEPGLRTYERRTRSTGRFVFGSRPSLNVAATARGRYEAEIYRRIARMWYAACDAHRGDIIPGSITVSLRLNKSGRIDSMELVRRRGASLIQQSFSFGAIRRAALPPMPAEVQHDIIGRLYEMILTFNFD